MSQDLGVRGATLAPRLGVGPGTHAARPLVRASALFGHGGGRLVVPNAVFPYSVVSYGSCSVPVQCSVIWVL
ncbi:hypothetical protein P4O66_004119 [Electrophorus voltai]|uniref:Uncharacterized protein n=1 Tax=Electrophorus voltai TaxID=2609070 RepID=A0AAD8ZQ10_9TELE|nr:hypothetical protein P4O66_004119 [Electrophorus voltai]